MRPQPTPPGPSSLAYSLPPIEDVPPQSHPIELTINTSPDHINLSTIDESPTNSEPNSLPAASAQSQLNLSVGGVGEVDETGAVVGQSINTHDLLNAEQGNVHSHHDAEETSGLPPTPTTQGTPLEGGSGGVSTPTVTPQLATDPLGLAMPNPPVQEFPPPIEGPEAPESDIEDMEPPPLDPMANVNSNALMPDNLNSLNFLKSWRRLKKQNQLRHIRGSPRHELSIMDVKQRRVTYEDLMGDEYDIQGINWQHMGITRSAARKCRIMTFRNYTNVSSSDAWHSSFPDKLLPRDGNYFRFRSMDLRRDVRLPHFQLRNIFACASRTGVYYPSTSSVIRELNPVTGKDKVAMKFRNTHDASTSTLAAGEGLLVAGGFFGGYRYRRTDAHEPSQCHEGRLTDHPSGITNHVQVGSSRRSSIPLAAFASNDWAFRVVDLATNKTIFEEMYDHALNCTAQSPDKRLRVMVGDKKEVMITDADTGECLQKLHGHRDFGFACDWAPDGWTVATGNQDKSVRIWDARKWKNSNGESMSVAVMRAEMAGIRSLRFSPLGSGKRVLVATEEADVINIIDAQTFRSKQTVDILGELAGVSFTNAGQELLALSSDPVRGGVLCLERCDYGTEDSFNYQEPRRSQNGWNTSGYDWLPTPEDIVDHPSSQVTLTQKRRQAAMEEDWLL